MFETEHTTRLDVCTYLSLYNMIVIRIGLGQTASGKILDGSTTSYVLNRRTGQDEKSHAIEQHLKTKKPIFISRNGRKYQEITLAQLREL